MPSMTTTTTTKLLRDNSFRIVGTLTNVDERHGNRKDNGQEYISSTLTISSIIGGKTNEFEVSVYSNRFTKDGKENQLFVTYSKLKELINSKVDVNGELRENRYWSSNLGQMISLQQLNGRFVRAVANSTVDQATFEIGGFIVKTPVEKTNKNGEVYRYDVTVGQSNYNGTSMNMYTLHINPSDREIISGVEAYEVGATVKLNGDLNFTVEQVTVTDNNNAFGAGVTKTFTNKQKNFYIKGGSNPLDGEVAYTDEEIKALIANYKANDMKLMESASANSADDATVNAAPVTKRQTSLI